MQAAVRRIVAVDRIGDDRSQLTFSRESIPFPDQPSQADHRCLPLDRSHYNTSTRSSSPASSQLARIPHLYRFPCDCLINFFFSDLGILLSRFNRFSSLTACLRCCHTALD